MINGRAIGVSVSARTNERIVLKGYALKGADSTGMDSSATRPLLRS